MKALNKAQLIGNLGKDPELRHTGSGTAVCSFSVATSDRFKDSSGEWQDKTEWHNVVVWAKLAEICAQYLKKGSKVYIEGSLQTRSYEKDGVTRYSTEINARDMIMLSPVEDKGRSDHQSNGATSKGTQAFAPDDSLPF